MKLFSKLLAIGLICTLAISAKAEDPSVICMAKVIYYEARGESIAGKLAVAKVTLNRMQSGKYPSTICGVVFQKGQYSWAKGKPPKIKDQRAWQESKNIAIHAISTGLTELNNFNAMFFHSVTSKPRWKYKRLAKIGKHIFYES